MQHLQGFMSDCRWQQWYSILQFQRQ